MFATSSQRERRGNRFTIVAVAEGIKLPPELRQIAHGGPVGNLVGEAISLISNKEVRVLCWAILSVAVGGGPARLLPSGKRQADPREARCLGNELGPH
jgi:hypothetical protein